MNEDKPRPELTQDENTARRLRALVNNPCPPWIRAGKIKRKKVR